MAEPLLRAEGLTLRDGAAAELASVSFSVQAGALAAVIGPDGRDKEALVRLLTGRQPPSQGTLRFAGRPISRLGAAARSRLGLGWTLRPPMDFATGTLVEAVALAMAARRPIAPLDAWRRAPAAATASAALAILQFVGLGSRCGCSPTALDRSGRARLELARVLATAPRLILVDRLTAILDPGECFEFVQLLRQLADGRRAVLWVEDDAALALEHADQLIAVSHGRTLSGGALDTPTRGAALEEAFLGWPG